MPEIEVKILGMDPVTVVQRLDVLGATAVFSGIVKCVHFDREKELRGSGRLFRLRRWQAESGFSNKFEICFKGPKKVIEGCKVREELETTVADADLFERIMANLGFPTTMDNEKHRRSYNWQLPSGEHVHFDIDEYPRVPAYMEIEGPNRAAIDEALAALELKDRPGIEVSTETAEELFARLWPKVDFEKLRF